MDLIRQVCELITPENWSNFVKHAEKEENVKLTCIGYNYMVRSIASILLY